MCILPINKKSYRNIRKKKDSELSTVMSTIGVGESDIDIGTYSLTVHVTLEQEMAIQEMFKYRGWTFITCNDVHNTVVVKSEAETENYAGTSSSASLPVADKSLVFPKMAQENSSSNTADRMNSGCEGFDNTVVVKSEGETENYAGTSSSASLRAANSSLDTPEIALEKTSSNTSDRMNSGCGGFANMVVVKTEIKTEIDSWPSSPNQDQANITTENSADVSNIDMKNITGITNIEDKDIIPFSFTVSPEAIQNNDVKSDRMTPDTCLDSAANCMLLMAQQKKNMALQQAKTVSQAQTLYQAQTFLEAQTFSKAQTFSEALTFSKENLCQISNQNGEQFKTEETSSFTESEKGFPTKDSISLKTNKRREHEGGVSVVQEKRPKNSN
ncbi:hypothetical protein MAR_035096 [Mya arenaria]|uniref:Uncharacterized protein n=1 Tax=Mya arenaria TaxID=6604 RepID=A0ABY7EJH9_MYAAR|nr:hypothetical protein MAR_035096 [Mya arenaria]